MSGVNYLDRVNYLDADTISQCHQALRDGGTLDDLAGRLHFQDTELLGRLLQLPNVKPAASNNGADTSFDLWAADQLADVL